ncbi:MAG TPA: hypothetical protein PKX91_05025 [Clostridia bacterium]|nr:hypothetical protein [Clostridia bacterium]
MKKPKLLEIINAKRLAKRFVVRTLIKQRKPITKGAVQIAKKTGIAKQVLKIIGLSLWSLVCLAGFIFSIVLMTVYNEIEVGVVVLILSLVLSIVPLLVRRIIKKRKKAVGSQVKRLSQTGLNSTKSKPITVDEMIEFDELED